MSYQRYYNPIQAESDQKDLIISQLKAELYELSQGQQDEKMLNQQISMLESKYQQLQEDQFRTEREGRNRADQDIKTIQNLRDEIDLLKQELVSRNREVQEFRQDNNGLQEMVKFRTNELQKVRAELQDIQDQGRKMLDQRKGLERTLKRLKDDRSQLSGENEALQNEYEQLYQKQRMQDQQIKDTELEINKVEKILNQQNKQGETKLALDIKNRQEVLETSKMKLIANEKNLQLLLNDISQLEKLIKKTTLEIRDNQSLHSTQVGKVRELTQKVSTLEKTMREKNLQADIIRQRLDTENINRNQLLENNSILNVEIEKSLDIVNLLTDIRKELLSEIALFQQEDEKALIILKRSDKQKEQLARSQNRMDASMGNISHFINKSGDQ